jgi:hypothetical protein
MSQLELLKKSETELKASRKETVLWCITLPDVDLAPNA